MRIIRNLGQAKETAKHRWGANADAWIVGGTRFVSRDRLHGNPANGWNHFDGQGETWDKAFIDASFKERIEQLQSEENQKEAMK